MCFLTFFCGYFCSVIGIVSCKYVIFADMKRLLILWIAVACLSLSAQTKSEQFELLNSYFDSINLDFKRQEINAVFNEMVQQKHFNGILLVAVDTHIVYKNVHGYADYTKKTKLTNASQYELASVSKQFTAVAILQLYEQNRLQLTDTIGMYIKDFPYPDITIHQLLCHRSGLPDYLEFAKMYHKNENYRLSNDSLLRMMQSFQPPVLAAAGEKFEYSNTGYAMLALVVEQVAQMPFHEYLKNNIFIPAGMTHTFVWGKNDFDKNGYTIGHKNGFRLYQRDFMSAIVGDKAVFSTAEDLFKWNKILYSDKILKDTTLLLAYMPKHADCPLTQNYGYGWRLTRDNHNQEIIYHGGLWNGNNNMFMRRLKDRACIVILSNCFNRSFGGRSDQILDILYAL